MNSLLKDIKLLKDINHVKDNNRFSIKLGFSDGTFAAADFNDDNTKEDVVETLLLLAALIEESI